jgi:hypothetical protein
MITDPVCRVIVEAAQKNDIIYARLDPGTIAGIRLAIPNRLSEATMMFLQILNKSFRMVLLANSVFEKASCTIISDKTWKIVTFHIRNKLYNVHPTSLKSLKVAHPAPEIESIIYLIFCISNLSCDLLLATSLKNQESDRPFYISPFL